MIIDSHCHLTHSKFKEAGLSVPDLIADARAAGVQYMNTICCNDAEFDELHAAAMTYPEVFCTYGVHPNHVTEDVIKTERILAQAVRDKVIGLGESGLDYYYDYAPKIAQKKSFAVHLEAAAELNLPVVIHTRSAERDTAAILEKHLKARPDAKLLFHCFSSDDWLADWGLEHDMYFSASGIVTFKKSTDLQAVFKRVPSDKILVETDAPYLAPTPHRSKICKPSYTAVTAQFVADLREVALDVFAAQTTDNFKALFTKAVPYIK